MSDLAPNAELLASLGKLVRGLSALFWGVPIALVVCVQTAKGEWLRPLGIVPAIAATGLLWYGVNSLGSFQKQERVWRSAWEKARLLALVNLGLAPFLFWWSKIPSSPFYTSMVEMMCFTGLLFLFTLNPLLWRLAAMLPDETLRQETKTFTAMNRYLILLTILLIGIYLVLTRIHTMPRIVLSFALLLEQGGKWGGVILILLPVAMTMALLWKTKEVILSSVFGSVK